MKFIIEKLLEPTLKRYGDKIAEIFDITSTKKLHSKVLRVFKAHDIKDTQIPLVVPENFHITLQDIEKRESFQEKISKEFLVWLVGYFNINPDWTKEWGQAPLNEFK